MNRRGGQRLPAAANGVTVAMRVRQPSGVSWTRRMTWKKELKRHFGAFLPVTAMTRTRRRRTRRRTRRTVTETGAVPIRPALEVLTV
jgi:predicted metal-dependent peptidase